MTQALPPEPNSKERMLDRIAAHLYHEFDADGFMRSTGAAHMAWSQAPELRKQAYRNAANYCFEIFAAAKKVE